MPVLIALLLIAPQDDDKKAIELFNKLRQKARSTDSLHVKFKLSAVERGREQSVEGELRIQGKSSFLLEMTNQTRRGDETLRIQSDGRRVRASGEGVDGVKFSPEKFVSLLRSSAADSTVVAIFAMQFSGRGENEDAEPTVTEIKSAGTEKGLTIVTYKIKYPGQFPIEISAKAWIHPKTLRVTKRELNMGTTRVEEDIIQMSLDAKLTAEDFSFINRRTLLRGRTGQVAAAVRLFLACTGALPRKPEDLLIRPEWLDPDIFWPEGGFWAGDKLPAEVPIKSGLRECRVGDIRIGPPTLRALVAPNNKLKKRFQSSVQLQLIAGAVKAYYTSYGELPRRKAALWTKPDWAPVWPEGGFLAGGPPSDPWGETIRIISDTAWVRVQLRQPTVKRLKDTPLSEDEMSALKKGGEARLSDDDRKQIEARIEDLSSRNLATREDSEAALLSMGAPIRDLVEKASRAADDPEAAVRLKKLLRRLPHSHPPWKPQLGRTVIVVRKKGSSSIATQCVNNLAQLWKMMWNYVVQFGGAMKAMPGKSGRDFWLELTRSSPPLIDETLMDIFVCPGSAELPGKDVCTYRGPNGNVNTFADGDPVGMCEDDSHGDSVIILRKSGDVTVVPRGDALHEAAKRKTTRD